MFDRIAMALLAVGMTALALYRLPLEKLPGLEEVARWGWLPIGLVYIAAFILAVIHDHYAKKR